MRHDCTVSSALTVSSSSTEFAYLHQKVVITLAAVEHESVDQSNLLAQHATRQPPALRLPSRWRLEGQPFEE
jgi:hypothetical protein